MRSPDLPSFAALAILASLLTGCALSTSAPPAPVAAAKIKGTVHGGQQPVIGTHIYLFAAGTSGYGGPSVSLISSGSAGTDSLGSYILSDASGGFSITGDYTCTTGTQVYLLAVGGNPGLSGNQTNPNLALMSALGQCPASGTLATALPLVSINEVTTIASVYALSGFMTDATHVSSSGTALSNTGMANAFANVNNLADIVHGAALATTPAGNGTVPQAEINTLANILASCVNSTGAGSSACSTLFSNALNGVTQPTDTVSAALNIAHNPGANVAAIYALGVPTPPFAPTLATAPNDFTLALNFTGAGINSLQYDIAIDAGGNAWIPSVGHLNVAELSSTGAPLSPSTGYKATGNFGGAGIAIDGSGNVWLASDAQDKGVSKLSSSGVLLSPSTGYLGGGLASVSYAGGIAIDSSNHVWVGVNNSNSSSSIANLASDGTAISPSSGYGPGGAQITSSFAFDASGNFWTQALGSLTKLAPAGTILIQPSGADTAYPNKIAVDASGNVWATIANGVAEYSSTGSKISPAAGYTGGGINGPLGVAIDGLGNVWVSNGSSATLAKLSSTGAALSPSSGYTGGNLNFALGLAIDGSGNVWAANESNKSVTEFVGVAAPVVTPIAIAAANNSLGARP